MEPYNCHTKCIMIIIFCLLYSREKLIEENKNEFRLKRLLLKIVILGQEESSKRNQKKKPHLISFLVTFGHYVSIGCNIPSVREQRAVA